MIIPREILQKHNDDALLIQQVSQRVRETLQVYCSQQGFVFDGRPKTIESLAEKIETGRFRSWSELDDLFACTVAVPLPSDEDDVITFLSGAFDRVDFKKRLSAKKAPDVFRFNSTRFIGRLRRPVGQEGTGTIFDIRFEVQIKSLFEFAWSKTTHALAYKSARVDWRALRLASALKASVEQMDLLLSDFDNAMNLLGKAPWREIEKKEFIQSVFLTLKEKIPSEAWPKDFSRFVDNCYSIIEHLQKSEQWRQRNKNLDIYNRASELLVEYVDQHMNSLFPRSISLFQVVFSVLTKTYPFPNDLEAWFPISAEMETLFPHVKAISSRFSFS